MVEKPKLELFFANMTHLKEIADKSKLLKNKDINKLTEMASELYLKGCNYFNKADEERAYICFLRFLSIITYLKEQPDFKKALSYYQIMLGQNAKDSMFKLEILDESLRERYNNRELKNKNPVVDAKESQNGQVIHCNRSTVNITTNFPNNKQGDTTHEEDTKIYLDCKELFSLIKVGSCSVLILDARPKDRFILSHMKLLPTVINVPADIIKPATIAKKLEDKLDSEFKPIFAKRSEYDKIVLLDEDSTIDDFKPNTALYTLHMILARWDPGINYHNKLFILNGGYMDWLRCYPSYTTNHEYESYSLKVATVNELDAVNYPLNEHTELPQNHQLPIISKFEIGEPDTVSNPKIVSYLPMYDRSKKPSYDKSIILKSKENYDTRQNNNDNSQSKEETDRVLARKSSALGFQSFPSKNSSSAMFRSPSVTSLASELETELSKKVESQAGDIFQTKRHVVSPDKLQNDRNRAESDKINEENNPGLMKRCLSTPNISKMNTEDKLSPDDDSLPFIDRSVKPRISNHYGSTILHSNENYRLTGLKNLGNTCYMNSIIQCLSNTQHFREKLLSQSVFNPKSKTAGKIAEEMKKIIQQLRSGELWISCKNLKNLVGQQRSIFRGYDQQDSHEFFTILIDCIHEDLNNPSLQPSLCARLDGAEEKTGEKAWGEFIRKNNSIVRDLFYGQLKSTIRCRVCQEESVTFEPFSNLSLPLPDSVASCTLQTCLQLYLQEETISEWKCPKCKQTRSAIKKLDIARLPPVLVLHFKRFTSEVSCKKKLTYVDFSVDPFDMTPYVLKGEHRNRIYELYAVSNHYGSMECGHYTAYCKTYKGWYKFDDQDVNAINNSSDIKSSEAYILFYNCIRSGR